MSATFVGQKRQKADKKPSYIVECCFCESVFLQGINNHMIVVQTRGFINIIGRSAKE